MTTVRLGVLHPTLEGAVAPTRGFSVRFTPTAYRTVEGEDGTDVVLPAPFTETAPFPETVELAATSGTWAWRVDLAGPGFRSLTWWVAVPDSGTTPDLADLTHVDPDTLDPTGTSEALFQAAIDAAIAAIADTV